jgi:UDP-N-acetyl-D-mannosaminuronate dehydrogenase
VVIITDHTGIDYRRLLDCASLVVDTRNALKGFRSEKIVRL